MVGTGVPISLPNESNMRVAMYHGCGIVAFVYWLRLKQYLEFP